MRPNDFLEAPTYLGSHQLPLPPEWLPGDDEVEPATRAARAAGPAYAPAPRVATERSVSRYGATTDPIPDVTPRAHGNARRRTPPGASPVAPEPAPPPAPPPARAYEPYTRSVAGELPRSPARATELASVPSLPSLAARLGSATRSSAARPAPEVPSLSPGTSRSSSRSRSRSRSVPSADAQAQAQGTAPAAATAAAAAAQAAPAAPSQPGPAGATGPAAGATGPAAGATAAAAQVLPNGMGAIDPMQVPVPPELAGPIYGWIRRLALQADLAGADRVLRDALADMTSSLTVSIVYPGESGLWTLGDDEEIPRDAQPIIAVGQARRAIVGSHTALVPVLTSTEVVAVVVLTRNPRNPGYHPFEQVAAIALAREAAAILHHLAVQHLQRAAEVQADKGGLYRGEALEAHRTRGQEGTPVHLSPGWVRRTYPILVATILAGVIAAVVITVPTYSTGTAVVIFDGTPITAPVGGTVDQLHVAARQAVKRGQALLRLNSAAEAAELAAATSDYENATLQYLFDPQDEQTKKTLASALTRVERARAQAEMRVVRARTDGVVGDLRIRVGSTLAAGDTALTIVQPNTEPEITAFLPGKDRPRLRVGMPLQVDLIGFTKARERAAITSISTEVVAGEEIASRILGPGLAGSFRQLTGANWVIVRAKLPSRTFVAEKRTHYYHHGLQAKVEVMIQSKPFLVTLLPALDRYVP